MSWRSRLRRTSADERLEREIGFHLDAHAADLMAQGMTPDDARRQAQLALGGREQVKEQCRDERPTRMLEDLLRDVRYAVRTFRQLPGFAAVALVVLALGIGATTVMFTIIDGVLLRPLSYPQPERLLTLRSVTEGFGETWGFSYPDFADTRRDSRSLAVAAWAFGGATVSAPGEPAYVNGRLISAELFPVLGVPLAEGRAFRPDDDRLGAPPVAIISDSLSRIRFGSPAAAIGRSLVYDGRPHAVVGVAPAGFTLGGDVDVLTPLGQNPERRMQNREARFIRVVARLADGVAPAEARAELTVIGRRLAREFPQSNAGRDLITRPLQEDVVGDVGSTLWLLLGAVAVVLVIACVNIASLLLARAVSRERELATRVALGASRGRVVRQCLTENAVLGIVGGVLGVLLARAAIGPFVSFWPGSLPRADDIHLDWRVLLASLAISLASGLAFGLAPALRVPVAGLEGALRAGGRTIARSSRRLHSAFIITELALAVVLLASAGMLARTLLSLSALDPGIDMHNVLVARLALSPTIIAANDPARIRAAWDDVIDRARSVPGAESAALTDIVPMRAGENSLTYSTTAAQPPSSQAPLALATTVSPDYLKVMGIPLRAGRFFDAHDRMGGEPVLVVDENLARHAFGQTDVVGRQLWVQAMGPSPLRIVGVVGHVRHWGLAADDRSRVRDQMYYPFAQVPASLLRLFSSFMSVTVRTTSAPLDIVEPLRVALRGASGDQALYAIRTMEELVSGSLARQRFLSALFATFAGVAMLLASVGIYGVLAYLTKQRTPEIGVRMALGATAGDVIRLVLRQSLGLVGIGVAIGIAGAWAAGRALEQSVVGMRRMEPVTLAAMTVLLVAAALLASFVPARRASRVDPTMALRQD